MNLEWGNHDFTGRKGGVITGGSRGIGAAAVKLFAQAGRMWFSATTPPKSRQAVEQETAKHGTRVEAFKADAGKHADNKKLWSTRSPGWDAWTF